MVNTERQCCIYAYKKFTKSVPALLGAISRQKTTQTHMSERDRLAATNIDIHKQRTRREQ